MAEAKRDQNRVTGLLLQDDTTGLTVPALRDSLGRLKCIATIADDTSIQKIIVDKNGTLIGTRDEINLIEGSNITLTVADNPGSNRVDITVAATGSGGAPTNATYVTLSTDATLTNERVLTAGSQITLTDGGAGGAITVASPFYFDATAGASGADFTSVQAAVNAGKIRILVIDNTTEPANTSVPVSGISIYIIQGKTVTMGTRAFDMANSHPVSISGLGTITYAHASAVPMFNYAGVAGIVTLRDVTVTNLSTVDETPISNGLEKFDNVRINAANVDHGGIHPAGGPSFYSNIRLEGGGSACARAADFTAGCSVDGLYFTGVFIAGAASDVTTTFRLTSSTAVNVQTVHGTNDIDFQLDNGTLTGLIAGGSKNLSIYSRSGSTSNQYSNLANFVTNINIRLATGDKLSNAVLNAGTLDFNAADNCVVSGVTSTGTLDLTDAGANNNKIDGCRFTNALTVAGVRNKLSNCDFLGGVTVPSGADNNGFINCQAGADAGGGVLTITIAAGSNNTRVVGCMTDAAISDAGTGTVLSANAVY